MFLFVQWFWNYYIKTSTRFTHHLDCAQFQHDGHTLLHLAAGEGDTTYMECLLSTPGIDVNIKSTMSCCFVCIRNIHVHNILVYMYMYVLIDV